MKLKSKPTSAVIFVKLCCNSLPFFYLSLQRFMQIFNNGTVKKHTAVFHNMRMKLSYMKQPLSIHSNPLFITEWISQWQWYTNVTHSVLRAISRWPWVIHVSAHCEIQVKSASVSAHLANVLSLDSTLRCRIQSLVSAEPSSRVAPATQQQPVMLYSQPGLTRECSARASDWWSKDRQFESRPVHCRVAYQLSLPSLRSGVGKSSTSLLAGVRAGRVHLCRVAGNTV